MRGPAEASMRIAGSVVPSHALALHGVEEIPDHDREIVEVVEE